MSIRLHKVSSAILVVVLLASLLVSARPAAAVVTPPKKLPTPQQVLQRVKSQVIVRFKDGVSAQKANQIVGATGGKVTKSLAVNNTKLADYSTDSTGASALTALNANSDVVYAFYNQRIKLPEDQSKLDLSSMRSPRRQGQASTTSPTAGRKVDGPKVDSPLERAAQAAVADGDPLRTYQYHLDRIGEPLAGPADLNAPTVAVIDSGLDYTSPDLGAAYQRCPEVPGLKCDLLGFDSDPMDTNGHGTLVAGTIAARSNSSGVRGVSPNSKILPVRIFGDYGSTDLITIFQALDYTTHAKTQLRNLRVANMSFSGYFLAGDSALIEFNVRIGNMRRAGILPVVSAGNDSDSALQFFPLVYGEELRVLPAQSPYALAVAATDQNDYRTFFSNYNTPILLNNCEKFRTDEYEEGFKICLPENTYTKKEYRFASVAAPGWEVLAPAPDGQYFAVGGTSFSSPIVAGVAARIMARDPGLTIRQVWNRINVTGAPLGVEKGFPRLTRRVDLRAALGNTRTGFTGRVVDGLTGQPLKGATVILKSGARELRRTQTNGAGFYTLTGATGGSNFTLTATKDTSPRYVGNSRSFRATVFRLNDPGTIALAPLRTDGSYTMMLQWNNVATGFYEYLLEQELTYFSRKPYPVPVKGASMPFAFLDSTFSVPFPEEPSDSITYTWYDPGALHHFPYASIQHDSEFDLSPHEGTIVRQLPPDHGPLRYGVDFFSAGGYTRPDATVNVYKGGQLLRRSRLDESRRPTDGTRGTGASLGDDFFFGGYSQWGLYDLRTGYGLRTKSNSPDGQRSDYREWVERNNDIRGAPGPVLGSRIAAELNPGEFDESSFTFTAGDYTDVYRIQLAAGKTYYFDLRGPTGTDWGLVLYRPGTTSINSYTGEVAYGRGRGPREILKYTVRANQGGQYYIVAFGYGDYGSSSVGGLYTLARPTTEPK